MRQFLRPLTLAAVFGISMLCTACGSNNKDKIVGKWKISDIPGQSEKDAAEFAEMSKMGMYVYFDFRPDNTMVMGVEADKPEIMEFVKAMAKGQQLSWTAKYKLLSRDGVEFYDLPKEMREKGGGLFSKDRGRTKIKIDGDKMTMTDDDGKTGHLVRIKNEPTPACKPNSDEK